MTWTPEQEEYAQKLIAKLRQDPLWKETLSSTIPSRMFPEQEPPRKIVTQRKNLIITDMTNEKPIDKVTVTNLDIALRMAGIKIERHVIDKIIDIVELLEEKGDDVSILDICMLQEEWNISNSDAST